MTGLDAPRGRQVSPHPGLCPRPDKRVYWTQGDAEDAIQAMQAASRPRSAHLNAYVCPCWVWHVGDVRIAIGTGLVAPD
jgi:hypothetical protein